MPRSRLPLALALMLALPLALSAPAGAVDLPAALTGAAASSVGVPPTAAGLPTTEVTLPTGDVVLVAPRGPDGPPYELRPVARPGENAGFSTTWTDGDLYVIPRDLEPFVGGLLDRDLFNVTALVEMGYDDRSTDRIPVVLEPAEGAVAVDSALLDDVVTLDLVGRTTGALSKDAGGAFRAALADGALGGVARVWLDRRFELPGAEPAVWTEPSHEGEAGGSVLDPNLVQIDAPAAWDAGLSGAGTTVAVLDSGIDSDHPDLVGKIKAAEDFTGGESVEDVIGFGTHTAGLIAGSGAGAGGARKGVAFGADLLNAKVVADDGWVQESWIMAGLEWSALQEPDLIHLGTIAYPGPAADALTAAVDDLIETTDIPVVVPAGDVFLSEPYTIFDPGPARRALTVGAVDGSDALAGFSGRGPTFAYGLKPDLLAPGEDIVSAVPGAEAYATRSSTAAAAAHASGALALFAEQHPEWGAEELRAAVMTNTVTLDGVSRYDQGGGRLDLGIATSAGVASVPASLDFGRLPYPHDEGATQAITLANLGAEELAVELEVEITGPDGGVAPDDFVELDDTVLTIPAGGDATTHLAVAALGLDDAPAGLYEGTVTITSGDSVSTIPVGIYQEPERYDLQVRVLDTAGEAFTSGGVEIFNKETFTRGFFPYEELGDDGEVTVRVAPGFYSVTSRVESGDGSLSILARPEVHVTEDTEVLLDAREALPIEASLTGTPADLVETELHYSIADEEGRANYYSFYLNPEQVLAGDVRVTPSEEGTQGAFHLVTRWGLLTAGGGTPPELYELVYQETAIPNPPSYEHDPADSGAMETIDSVYRGLGSPTTMRSYRAFWSDVVLIPSAQFRQLAVPSHRIEHVLAAPGVGWYACVVPNPTIRSDICDGGRPARGGHERRTRWLDVVHPNPAALERWDATTMFTQMGLSDGGHEGITSFEPWASTTLTLYDADGDVIDSVESDFAYFTVEPGTATYILEHVAEIEPGFGARATSATTRWTFESSEPEPPEFDVAAYVDVGFRPATDDLGYAEPGKGLKLGVRSPQRGYAAAPPPILAAQSWVSADGGATWLELPLREPDEGGQRFLTRIPRRVITSGQPLSLRVELLDAAGTALEQTLIDTIDVR